MLEFSFLNCRTYIFTGAYFREGSGPVFSYLSCPTGRESHIAECSMGTVGGVNCHHGRDAAVRCQCEELFSYCIYN